MSTLTDAILCCEGPDFVPGVIYVNHWLAVSEHQHFSALREAADMTDGLWARTFRNIDVTGLINAVRSAPWDHPEMVQLFLRTEPFTTYIERAKMEIAHRIDYLAAAEQCPKCLSHRTQLGVPSSGVPHIPWHKCAEDGCRHIWWQGYGDVKVDRVLVAERDRRITHKHNDYFGPASGCPYC